MSKILSFEEAYEYVMDLDERDEKEIPSTPTDMMNDPDTPNSFGGVQEVQDVEDLSRMMENFERYLQNVLNDLREIIKNSPELLDEVELKWEYLGDNGVVAQIYIEGFYKDFDYQHVLVTPKRDWDNDRERLIQFIKAIVIREYRRYE